MKKFTLFFLLSASIFSFNTKLNGACNWKSQISGFSVSDTCKTGFGSITLKNVNCTYLVWTINGTLRTQGKGVYGYTSMSFPITVNGTYNICVKVTDTCNKCDTTLCATLTISCFKTCNWKSKINNFYSWDTCNGSGANNSLNAYIAFNTKGCFKYEWKVNNNLAGKGNILNYKVTANGTYSICLKVTDTCNKCDTILCSTRSITCFNKCNWKSRSPYIYFTDTCKGKGLRNTIHGYISFNNGSCNKYSWTVNGSPVSTSTGYPYWLVFNVSQNGIYTVCVKVTDTCNNCDTTYCSTKTFSCFNSCNWKSLKPSMFAYDSCKGSVNKIMTGISFNGYYSGKYKHLWTMNGAVVGNSGSVQQFPVTSNGTYTICVKSYDTTNKCDTTICMQVVVNCMSSCNWKGKSPNMTFWDTCKGQGGVNSTTGYIGLNSRTCQKYVWTVNGVTQTTKNYYIHYPVTHNGTYVICVKVIDTCNNCDTTFCTTRTFTCFPSCNWKSKISNFYAWDSCNGNSGRNSVNAYIAFNTKGCFKYQWKVNTALAGNSNVLNYKITSNGTYTVCVKVSDTCNNCDTILCSTRTISCFTNACNWKSKVKNFYAWDTCKGVGSRNSVNAYIALNTSGCFKFQWTVNGVSAGNASVMNYKITGNGNYYICVKVTDTCNKCDTTLCAKRIITCFNTCNFKARGFNFSTMDTCIGSNSTVKGYISFNNKNCLKYLWTVAGVAVGTGPYFNASIYKNGTYVICVKVTDTCTSSKCDTTFCTTRTIYCSGLGITKNNYLTDNIRIYPNPVQNLFNIDWKGEKAVFEVVNLLGELVYFGELKSPKTTIATETWSNGLYMVRVKTKEGTQIFKIIVNH